MNVKIEKEGALSDNALSSLLNIPNYSIPFSSKKQSNEVIHLDEVSENSENLEEIPFNGLLMQIKMQKAESQEKSLKGNSSLSTIKDNALDEQKKIKFHRLGKCLNPNSSITLKIENKSATKVKASSVDIKQEHTTNNSKLVLEQQVAGLLLPSINQCESMDISETSNSSRLKNNNKPNVGSTSFDRTPLESSIEVMASSSHSSSSKRPRLNVTPVSNAQLLNKHHIEEPSKLEKTLKRYSRKELEQIIMGHMVGYVSAYKPFADIEQELESCKKQIEHLQKKNNSLTKEVVDLNNIVRSFVTKDAKNYTRPIKQLRSVGVQVVGVQVNPIDVKLEKNANLEAYSCVVKCEKLKPFRNKFISTHDTQVPRNVEEDDSASTSSSVSIPVKKREDSREKDVPQPAITRESVKTKVEDDDLMVMFDNSTNFTQSDVSLNQPIPPLEPIPPKPIIAVAKTTDNSTSALRISWKFPENSKHATVASCRVFMLSGNKKPFVSDNDWIPVGGNTSRMSCTIPLGRRDKLRNRYQFRVIATDIHGREGPYSDVAHADFP